MDGRACALCGGFAHAHGGVLGALVGPFNTGSASAAASTCFVHRLCALWAPEVHEDDHGRLKNVGTAVRRGRGILCAHCGRRGATVGCRVERCPCSYHLWCATQANCRFYVSNFLLACPAHAKLFPEGQKLHSASASAPPTAPHRQHAWAPPPTHRAPARARERADAAAPNASQHRQHLRRRYGQRDDAPDAAPGAGTPGAKRARLEGPEAAGLSLEEQAAQHVMRMLRVRRGGGGLSLPSGVWVVPLQPLNLA